MRPPSSYFPDYFALEITPSLTDEVSLATTLDSSVDQFSDRMVAFSLTLSPNHYTEASQRQFLSALGLSTSCLTAEKTFRLFQSRTQLFDASRTADHLALLSELYFGESQIDFKQPVAETRLKNVTLLQVGDLRPSGTTCRITYRQHPESKVTHEFEANVRALSADAMNFYYYLLQPKAAPAREGRRLTPWRLPCLTLAK